MVNQMFVIFLILNAYTVLFVFIVEVFTKKQEKDFVRVNMYVNYSDPIKLE